MKHGTFRAMKLLCDRGYICQNPERAYRTLRALVNQYDIVPLIRMTLITLKQDINRKMVGLRERS